MKKEIKDFNVTDPEDINNFIEKKYSSNQGFTLEQLVRDLQNELHITISGVQRIQIMKALDILIYGTYLTMDRNGKKYFIFDSVNDSLKDTQIKDSIASEFVARVKATYPQIKVVKQLAKSDDEYHITKLYFDNVPGQDYSGFGNDPRTKVGKNVEKFMEYTLTTLGVPSGLRDVNRKYGFSNVSVQSSTPCVVIYEKLNKRKDSLKSYIINGQKVKGVDFTDAIKKVKDAKFYVEVGNEYSYNDAERDARKYGLTLKRTGRKIKAGPNAGCEECYLVGSRENLAKMLRSTGDTDLIEEIEDSIKTKDASRKDVIQQLELAIKKLNSKDDNVALEYLEDSVKIIKMGLRDSTKTK